MPFPAAWTTARLAAEQLTVDHFDDLLVMHSDPVQMAMLGGVKDEAETRAYLQRNLDHWARYNFGLWMLRSRETGSMIGRGMLRTLSLDDVMETEVGYSFNPAEWGRGLGTEIAEACVQLGRDELQCVTLVAITQPGNVASRKVLEKVGMTFEREMDWPSGRQALYRWRAEV
jgi:RimJ/RimL family protein N-acetyltransferase